MEATKIELNSDAEFLKNLARELKTQDRLATAKPVLWQIRDEELVIGYDPEYADDVGLFFCDASEVVTTVEDAVRILQDFGKKDLPEFTDLQEIEDYCDIEEINCYYTGYQYVEKFSGAFLTRKAAEAHIEANRHHYERPTVFCTHVFRNPELERLLRIIEDLDNPGSSKEEVKQDAQIQKGSRQC